MYLHYLADEGETGREKRWRGFRDGIGGLFCAGLGGGGGGGGRGGKEGVEFTRKERDADDADEVNWSWRDASRMEGSPGELRLSSLDSPRELNFDRSRRHKTLHTASPAPLVDVYRVTLATGQPLAVCRVQWAR